MLSVGAWAYAADGFGLEGSGAGAGPSVEYFEILATLSGLEAILAVDRTQRVIRVHTDSEFALRFLRYASERAPLPRSKAMDRVRMRYEGATTLISQRCVYFSKVTHSMPEHKACHRSAARRLRQELAGCPDMKQRVGFRTAEQRVGVPAEGPGPRAVSAAGD